jgi:hypothetical protein
MAASFQLAVFPVPPWRRVPTCRAPRSPVAASFQLAVLPVPPWRRVSNLPCCHSPVAAMHRRGRQSFRRSEIPTCHPERHGTHNKSDILLVSSTFADPRLPLPPWRRVSNLPCSPFPRGGEFLTCRMQIRAPQANPPVARPRAGNKRHHDACLGTRDPDFPELTCETWVRTASGLRPPLRPEHPAPRTLSGAAAVRR